MPASTIENAGSFQSKQESSRKRWAAANLVQLLIDQTSSENAENCNTKPCLHYHLLVGGHQAFGAGASISNGSRMVSNLACVTSQIHRWACYHGSGLDRR